MLQQIEEESSSLLSQQEEVGGEESSEWELLQGYIDVCRALLVFLAYCSSTSILSLMLLVASASQQYQGRILQMVDLVDTRVSPVKHLFNRRFLSPIKGSGLERYNALKGRSHSDLTNLRLLFLYLTRRCLLSFLRSFRYICTALLICDLQNCCQSFRASLVHGR